MTITTPLWWDGCDPHPAVPLPPDCDTAIVGGGIAGIVAAIELARAGQSVTVIEANRVGGGATGASLGVLSTPAAGAGFGDPDELVNGRARKTWHLDRLAAQRYLLRLIEESGRDCNLRQGVVLLAPTARNFESLAATVEARNEYYGTRDYMLNAEELAQEAGGNAGSQFAGALVMSDAHYVQPARMITGLADMARKYGVSLCERTDVVGVRPDDGGFRVNTNGGDIGARDVLLTTGGYTGDYDTYLWQRTLGLPSVAVATEELPPAEVEAIFPSGRVLLVNRFQGYSCRPSADGRRIVLGGPVGQTPGTPEKNVRRLQRYFLSLFPDLRGVEFTHCWTGMIAATRDAQGHTGANDGIWYAVGASGLVSSADAGRRMAQNILHADKAAAAGDPDFPRWPMRKSESLLWRSVEVSTRMLDLMGRSRLR